MDGVVTRSETFLGGVVGKGKVDSPAGLVLVFPEESITKVRTLFVNHCRQVSYRPV